MPKIAILLNNQSGLNAKESEVSKLLEGEKYANFTIIAFKPEGVEKKVIELVKGGYEVVVGAGGDGTVSAVASAIVRNNLKVKLGVLPLGTFNHFSKDLGIPAKIEDAMDVISKANSTYVDIGQVNDTYFINNSSCGLYPRIVKLREEYRKKGWHKLIAFGLALFSALNKDKHIEVEFISDSKTSTKKAQFVFVGNNKYEMEGLSPGSRNSLDQGVLSLCVAKKNPKWKMLSFVIHALKGTLSQQEYFNSVGLTEFAISSKKSIIDVSHDGEVSPLKTPLHYKILPKALWVIIP